MSQPNIEDACKAIQDAWPIIKNEFFQRNPGRYLVLSSVYRSPEDQFNLFKKGRENLPSGEWVVTDKSRVVTNVDGFKNIGAHNYKPSRAIDVTIFDNQTGQAIWEEASYHCLLEIASGVGLESGGSWKSLKDWPHLQVPNFKDYVE
jgi:peptidoglycan L-alanyl-D-glutamate endopeptidase CwlK